MDEIAALPLGLFLAQRYALILKNQAFELSDVMGAGCREVDFHSALQINRWQIFG